jgi:2-oxoglutarate dehydrogenase E2 component (dihydrolipoamide succinyltransferase)
MAYSNFTLAKLKKNYGLEQHDCYLFAEVAILAIGAIKKKPAVVETPYGDLIAVRHLMFLSLSYDHRVVDGALGSSFLRRIADYFESFDGNQSF